MYFRYAQGRLSSRLTYRLMSTSCALVSCTQYARVPMNGQTDCPQAFALYGYDAGVLGGVQNTKPFLDAIGVGQALPRIVPDDG